MPIHADSWGLHYQHLPRGEHKPMPLLLTLLQSWPAATTVHHQHLVFNFITCARIHRCDKKPFTQMQLFQTHFQKDWVKVDRLPARRDNTFHYLYLQFCLILNDIQLKLVKWNKFLKTKELCEFNFSFTHI